MNHRTHRQNLFDAMMRVAVLDTRNMTPLDALKADNAYAKHLCSVVAESLGDIMDDTRVNAGCFLGSTKPAPEIYGYLEDTLLSEQIEAIEHAEAQADEPYLLAAE